MYELICVDNVPVLVLVCSLDVYCNGVYIYYEIEILDILIRIFHGEIMPNITHQTIWLTSLQVAEVQKQQTTKTTFSKNVRY